MEVAGNTNARNVPERTRLDARFVARQKGRLETMRETLLRTLQGIDEDEKEWTEESLQARHDRSVLGSYAVARELDAALEKRLKRRLGLIERALAKIEEGTYGLCDATGEPIPRERLEAIPEAIYTVEAQRRQEGRL
jgi:DnaK suppressor protein